MTYTYEVPLSYTVNVSLSATPAGLADFNTNSIAIFSNEVADFSENYKVYLSSSEVEVDFGSESLTYKMAKSLFTPVPNFRTGGGYLYIFPFKGINATSASATTPNISLNVDNFRAVSNGVLNIEIDGEETQVTNLDFTMVKTVADIANVIRNKNLDIYVEVIDGCIKFTSKRFGSASCISILTATNDVGTDIASEAFLKKAEVVVTEGVDASGDSLAHAVKEALAQVYFGGVLTTQYQDNVTLLENATAIEELDVTYYESMTSLKNIAVLGSEIKTSELGKTRSLAYSLDKETAKIAIATYATIAKSVNYAASNSANTMNLKTLTGVFADRGLSDTYLLSAQSNGVDVYGNTGGLSVVYSNNNNGYTDDIENQLWIKKSMEIAGFNYLRQTNTKIPQTESGMTGLKNAYAQVCEKAIRNGVVAAGSWNGAIPFGEPEDFKRNIEEKGYYVYSVPNKHKMKERLEKRQLFKLQLNLVVQFILAKLLLQFKNNRSINYAKLRFNRV